MELKLISNLNLLTKGSSQAVTAGVVGSPLAREADHRGQRLPYTLLVDHSIDNIYKSILIYKSTRAFRISLKFIIENELSNYTG